MRILLVYPFLPYPPDDGGRIGFFNPIKYLSRRHEVSVVCLRDGSEQEEWISELKTHCADLQTYERHASRDVYRLAKGMVIPPPGSSAKYWDDKAGELIRETIARRRPEIVEFHHLNTAIYRNFAGSVPTILREHNVEYKVWERHAESASTWVERTYAKWTAPRVKRYEAEATSRFDRCIVVSQTDAAHLRKVSPRARIEMIPSGVDTEYFHPLLDVPDEPLSMTLTGSFDWKPKQQSLSKLIREIFPRIRAKVPEAKLYVVGKGVPEHLRRIARETPGITVTGRVEDVRPYIARSALLLNYLESGGGIALKILEAMAMRKPVLSNSLGSEGIDAEPGREVALADGPEKFAEAACYLLANAAARRALAENAYQKILESYSWDVIADQFQSCYEALLEKRRYTHTGLAPATSATARTAMKLS